MNYRQVILFFCAFFVVTLSSAQIFEVRDELNESSKRSYGMGVGDLDGNGLDDIILSNSSIGKISWKPQVSPREFGSEIIISMDTLGAWKMFVADLDSDGLQDIFWAGNVNAHLGWKKNLGGGEFSASQEIPIGYGIGYNLKPKDLDLDGDIDILFNLEAWNIYCQIAL
jgi:hypothetical protein